MTYYEKIYEHAVDNYGLITSFQANAMGIPNIELVKLAHRGRLVRVGHGVYRLAQHTPTSLDPFAEAVTLVGEGAYLFGESVIAMHDLAPTNPSHITVATPKRTRRNLPSSIRVIHQKEERTPSQYEGIASQSITEAIRDARDTMMIVRLEDAAKKAQREGLITKSEEMILIEDLHND